MVKDICIDTGIITQFFAKNTPERIINLFEGIRKKSYFPYILSPVLIEVYKHLCISSGKYYAESSITSLLDKYPHTLVNYTRPLIFKAGELKCQFREKLSLVDCSFLGFCILNKMELHTTEKNLPGIPKLKVITYDF